MAEKLSVAGQHQLRVAGSLEYDFAVTAHTNSSVELVPARTGYRILVLGWFCEPDGSSGTARLRSGTSTATTDNIFEMDVSNGPHQYHSPYGITITKEDEGLYVNLNVTANLNNSVIYMYVKN